MEEWLARKNNTRGLPRLLYVDQWFWQNPRMPILCNQDFSEKIAWRVLFLDLHSCVLMLTFLVCSVLITFPRMNALHRQATHGWHNAPRHFCVVDSLLKFQETVTCCFCRFTIYGVPSFGKSRPAQPERSSPLFNVGINLLSVVLLLLYMCPIYYT